MLKYRCPWHSQNPQSVHDRNLFQTLETSGCLFCDPVCPGWPKVLWFVAESKHLSKPPRDWFPHIKDANQDTAYIEVTHTHTDTLKHVYSSHSFLVNGNQWCCISFGLESHCRQVDVSSFLCQSMQSSHLVDLNLPDVPQSCRAVITPAARWNVSSIAPGIKKGRKENDESRGVIEKRSTFCF